MDEASVAQFCAVTGLEDPSQASMFLEMAGGNMEMAMSLFFDNMGGDGGGGNTVDEPSGSFASATESVPDWFRAVWPQSIGGPDAIPAAWSQQALSFEDARFPVSSSSSSSSVGKVGLVQPQNGPCGVLASVQAVCLARIYQAASGGGNSGDAARIDITPEVLAASLSDMIWQARPSEDRSAVVALPPLLDASALPSPSVVSTKDCGKREDLDACIKANLGAFAAAGGVVLLVYSLVLTRTLDRVKSDVMSSGGELPLITEPFFLCTSDLVSLCLRGIADGHVGAYLPIPGGDGSAPSHKRDWPEALGVGLLSMSEHETKIPVADMLKSPKCPVWVLHGGDHFTVLWTADLKFPRLLDDEGEETMKPAEFALHHWNGLPPNGPRLGRFFICASRQAKPSPAQRETPKHFEPLTGEIESIVQADPEMKKASPEGWSSWRYEVQLASDVTRDPDEKYDPRPEGMEQPLKFDIHDRPPPPEAPWRCPACYATRFKTMCFGINDPPSGGEADPRCRHCEKPRSEVGWTVWLTYEELPSGWKRSVDRQFAPKIVTVLRTKWPGCKVTLVDDEQFGKGTWPSA